MASQVDIVNLALGRLGQDRGISAMSDESKEARIAGRTWDTCRDEVLEARVWPFALKAQPLAVDATEAPHPGWRFRYSIPEDCLNIKALTDEAGLRGSRSLSLFCDPYYVRGMWCAGAYDYEVVHGEQDTSIMSDLPKAIAVYVVRVTDTGRYSAHFVDALAWRLAAELAPAIIGIKGITLQGNILQGAYPAALSTAAALAANQSRGVVENVTPSLAARG